MSIKTLIVDDERGLLDQAEKFLDELDRDIEISTAISASKALEILEKNDFDVIVSDYMMPEMDGIELLKTLREERDSDIPFIMLTGKGKEEVAMKALNFGANRYLQKFGEPKPWYDILGQTIEQEVKQFKAEKRILESEERYRKLFESAQDGMLIIDAETGMIQSVNPRLQEITDYPEEKFIGKGLWKLDAFKNIVDRKKDFQHLCEESYIRQDDKQLRTKDGEDVPVEFVSTTYYAGGKEIVQCNIREISERKKAEEELKESKERFKKLFDASPDLTYFLDRDGVFQEVNQAGMDLLGYEREELIGKHFSELPFLPPETKEKITEKFKKRLQGEEISPYTIEAETKNGEQLFAEVNSALIEENGDPIGSIGIVRNITERKKAEKALEESRSRLEISQRLAKVGSWEMDPETDELTWTDETYSIFEIPKDESIDYQDFLDKVHPEDRDLVDSELEEILEEGGITGLEHRIIVGDDTKWVREIADVNLDEDGKPVYVRGSVQDITEQKEAKQKLKRSKERIETLISNAEEGIYIRDLEGTITYVNEKFAEIHGYEKDELIGMDADELLTPKWRKEFQYREKIEGVNSDLMNSTEIQIETKDGEVRDLLNSTSMTVDEEGNKEILGIVRDITERKKTKERLKKSEERYRRLFESAQDGILILDAETGKIEDVNPYLEDLVGHSEEKLIGKEMWEIDTFRKIAETGKEFEELLEKRHLYFEDVSLETKEGTQIPVEIEINTYYAVGKKVVQCKIIDISAKKSRKSLQEAVMRFRKLSEASPNAIILVNKETGVIKDVNQVAEELLNMERGEIIGNEYLSSHPEDVKEDIREVLNQPIEESLKASKEVRIIDSDGREIPVKMRTSSLVLGDEEIIYFVLNDISKRKKAEEREEFLHSLLRHELRNKIHISKGNLDLLKESGVSEEKKEFLDDAMESYEEGMEIIEKVRDMKKLGQDEVKEVLIDTVVDNSVDEYRSEAESKGMEIELDMDDVTAKVKGGELLPEVFSNLISNSIRHSNCDNIAVSVKEEEEEVICTVEDDGMGIPQEKKDEIFEKGFTTVNSSSGLGLYLVKDIMSHYGGSIELKDSDLGGARFDVHLQKV